MPSTRAPTRHVWLTRNVALTAAELACAVLALPFVGAAPFWPGAALGVVAALRWGWRGMPGVFVGTAIMCLTHNGAKSMI